MGGGGSNEMNQQKSWKIIADKPRVLVVSIELIGIYWSNGTISDLPLSTRSRTHFPNCSLKPTFNLQ